MNHQHYSSWQHQLSNAFHTLSDLCEYLELDPLAVASVQAAADFPLKVPRSFAQRMEKGNPDDPLLKQVLPVAEENLILPGFSADPVGDLAAIPAAGVIHKYHGRALLTMTGSCAVNCRYCFRRNFPYSEFQLTQQRQQQAIAYLQHHQEISEIILSGGEPLVLSDEKLRQWLQQFDALAHVKRIRIHTRFPIVLPARITDELLQVLTDSGKQLVMVLHCNHTHELNNEVKIACEQMKAAGITLLNQAVLLKGVNDCATQLHDLSEKLFSFGVLPYYLHLLDRAQGTGHFEVGKDQAQAIMRQLQNTLPGYLVPRLAQEQSGKAAKTLVFWGED